MSGLQQLEKVKDNIYESPHGTLSMSGFNFTPQLSSRRLKALNKDHLQVEGEENDRQLEAKIVEDSTSGKFKCKDCSWTGKFKHKAKAHARTCGQRPKKAKKLRGDKKFACSKVGCGLTFSAKTKLIDHYR